MNEPPILTVSRLSHAYGEVKAVRDVSLIVRKGEIFSLLGPNGAGKSTAINVLITLLPLQEGEVSVAGHDLRTGRQQVREAIGIVFQAITLDKDMTVREILDFHGDLYGMDRREKEKRIDELLSLVELTEKADTLTHDLSGGMKRRLEIARGLMTRPEILFLDEPTIGLDPQTRRRTWEYLRSVNEEGTTIFLTTHYMDEADLLSDRISIVDHGEIIIEGTPWELKNSLGTDIMYLETEDNGQASALIADLPGIGEIRQREGGILVMTKEDGRKILPRLILCLDEAGIPVKSVNLKKPTMDDVFLHYTGRALRG